MMVQGCDGRWTVIRVGSLVGKILEIASPFCSVVIQKNESLWSNSRRFSQGSVRERTKDAGSVIRNPELTRYG